MLTGNDITGGRGASTRDMRKMPSRRRNTIDPLELQAGDFVVHEQHGIGRYVELVQRTVNGADREYLVIEYAPSKRGQPGDRLFVPTDPLDQLSRYVGGEAPDAAQDGRRRLAEDQGPGPQGGQRDRRPADPALRRPAGVARATRSARTPRGSASWRTPSRTRRRPTSWPPSTRSSADMEQPVPMDRLICGDVGYGKTEIAVRAAFKAVQDGKQVAVLVPTTLLAQQHFNTFSERMAPVPGDDPAAVPVPDAEGGRADAGAWSPTAPSTSSSAPTGCCRPPPGSRTSAWSSSTRSSASASSTRST